MLSGTQDRVSACWSCSGQLAYELLQTDSSPLADPCSRLAQQRALHCPSRCGRVQLLRMALGMRKHSARLEMLRSLLPAQELPAGTCCAVHVSGQLLTSGKQASPAFCSCRAGPACSPT